NINQELLAAILKKTGLSRAQVYARIKQTASSEFLPRNLAAIRVGASVGLAINRYASSDELSQLRSTGSPVAPPNASPQRPSAGGSASGARKRAVKATVRQAPNAVFVVHGRDAAAKNAMFAFLRSIDIKPIEWTSAIAFSKKATPYVGEILDAAFAKARAIVVLMTPDDLAQLRPICCNQVTNHTSGCKLAKRVPMFFSKPGWLSSHILIERSLFNLGIFVNSA